ncbi:MAG: TonB-dependent receptor [Bacteroidota bacterium]
MYRILFLLGWWIGGFSAPTTSAQTAEYNIQGQVLDSLERPLVGATVLLLQSRDSLLQSFAIADAEGAFRVQARPATDYTLRITFVGYGTFERRLRLPEPARELDLGSIVLNPAAYALAGATVTDTFIPIVLRGDTVEYNAAAFPTGPNAVVEDLLRRLPGIEVDRDGTIRAEGEEVQNILVDGKPFFDDDPKIASRNLPADIVDKVQLFDRASDFSEFTGIDDGRGEKTLNLAIKTGKNKGLFGRVSGAYGWPGRGEAALNLNRFNEKLQLSALGNANSLNEPAFSLNDYLDFLGGVDALRNGELDPSALPSNLLDNAGISTLASGGLNLNYDFNPRWQWRSNYFFDYSDNQTSTTAQSRRLLEGGSFRTVAERQENRRLRNHRLSLQLRGIIDSTQDLRLQVKTFFSADQNGLRARSEAFVGPESRTVTTQQNTGWGNLKRSELGLTYRKRLSRRGRFFLLRVDGQGQLQKSEQQVDNQIQAGSLPPLSFRQRQPAATQPGQLGGEVNYVEPLGKTKYLTLTLSHRGQGNTSEQLFFDQSQPEREEEITTLSNRFRRRTGETGAGLQFQGAKNKLDYRLGLELQSVRLDNRAWDQGTDWRRRFFSVLPRANLRWDLSTTGNLSLNYDTRLRIPNLRQLQPTIDNRDPSNLYQGNPELAPEYLHEWRVQYQNFNRFYFRSLFAGLRLQRIDRNIIEVTRVDEQLNTLIRPRNGGAAWTASAYYDWRFPFSGLDLKLGLSGNGQFSERELQVNESIDRNRGWTIDQTLQLENKFKQKLDWIGGYRLRFNRSSFSDNPAFDQTYWQHDFFLDTRIDLLPKWSFSSRIEWQHYGAALFDERTDLFLLDLEINRSFLAERLNVFIRLTNLLDEDLAPSRNAAGLQASEVEQNRLGRVILLGAAYRLRAFGK